MKLYNAQTQQWEEVADPSKVQANFLAGTHSFSSDAEVPVKDTYGRISVVPASGVDALLAKGGNIVSQEEADQQKLQKEYGGLGGQAITAVEGAGRGLSVGALDPLAIEGARAFGGDESAEKVRKHLENYKAANPKTALGSEIVGALAPAVLSEGGTAGESAAELGVEGARLAARPSIVGTIARYSPAGLVDRAGMAATRAAESVIGTRTASSALGRIAQSAATHAIGDAVPGAIYGAAGQLDEDYLSGGNHALTAEKTIAALGHGALWGVLLGGGLGAAGASAREVAAPLLRKASPTLEREAGQRMWAAAGGSRSEEAAEIGNSFLRKSGLGERSITEGALTPQELAPIATRTRVKTEQELEGFLRDHGAHQAMVDPEEFIQSFENVIGPQRGKIGQEGTVRALEKIKAEAMSRAGLLLNDAESIGLARQHAYDLRLTPGTEEFKMAELSHRAELASEQLAGKQVPLETLKQIRQEIGELKGANPGGKIENLHKALSELEDATLDKQAKTLGLSDTAKADYKQLKADLNNLRKYEAQAQQGALKHAEGDHGATLMAGLMAVAHGNLPGAAIAVGTAMARKAIKSRSAALAGVTLNKLSKLDLLARASQAVDRDLERAAGTLVGKKGGGRASRFTGPDSSASAKAKWKHASSAYPASQTVTPDHLERALPGLITHAPKVARAIVQKLNQAALYATLNAPKPLNKPTLVDPSPKPRVTALDAEAHYDRIKAIEDPVEVLANGAETGRLSVTQFQTIKANHPELLEDFKGKVLDELSKPHPPLSSDQVRFLSTLFEGGGDELSDPAVASVVQKAYLTPAAQPPGAMAKPASKPIEGLADSSKTRLQAVRAQHQPGNAGA